jgi:GrpB-like predicted nucleotidyltransferase (UPF0157 family)
MNIQIEAYNAEWATQFKEESNLLNNALLNHRPLIEHIGSTSIKGLGAKPIVDILIGLPNFKNSKEASQINQKLGSNYLQEFQTEMPNRQF